jgi:hypothetical protein
MASGNNARHRREVTDQQAKNITKAVKWKKSAFRCSMNFPILIVIFIYGLAVSVS